MSTSVVAERATTSAVVSVVIPTTGAHPLLAACLESLHEQSGETWEAIVVSGGRASPDTALAASVPGIRVIDLDENVGFAAAANAGAELATAPFLVFLNDDVELEPGWLDAMLACLDRHPNAAAVCGKILRRDRRTLDGAGDAMTRALKAYRRGQGRPDDGQFEREEEVFSVPGTACVWRSDAFRRLGGFDASFFAYYEDVDLGFRARLRGHEFWYDPTAVAIHHGGATSKARPAEFESYYSVRNRWTMIFNNVPRDWLLRDLHWLMLGELTSLLRAVIRREFRLYVRGTAEAVRRGRDRIESTRDDADPMTLGTMRALCCKPLPPLSTSIWRFHVGGRLRDAARSEADDRAMLRRKG
jgi:GT2 family glycosyltransferase